jgi:hypothetical protein
MALSGASLWQWPHHEMSIAPRAIWPSRFQSKGTPARAGSPGARGRRPSCSAATGRAVTVLASATATRGWTSRYTASPSRYAARPSAVVRTS